MEQKDKNSGTLYVGTELKLNVNIAPMGDITMDDYDFDVEVYCTPSKIVKINKQDARRIDESNYIVTVDSSLIGSGTVKCKVIAYVPDTDFMDGMRTEVSKVMPGITLMEVY